MSAENPNLITHVPTQAELEASRPSENAINFHDPVQLEAYNADLRSLGLPGRAAPGERKPFVLPAAPPVIEHEPYKPSEHERRISREELREIREQLAREAGSIAITGDQQK